MNNPIPTKPALIRLGAAAQALGLTPEHLAGAVLDKTIPLRVVRVCKSTYFRAAELNAWLKEEPAPRPSSYDLF
jgi:hypothetical protein